MGLQDTRPGAKNPSQRPGTGCGGVSAGVAAGRPYHGQRQADRGGGTDHRRGVWPCGQRVPWVWGTGGQRGGEKRRPTERAETKRARAHGGQGQRLRETGKRQESRRRAAGNPPGRPPPLPGQLQHKQGTQAQARPNTRPKPKIKLNAPAHSRTSAKSNAPARAEGTGGPPVELCGFGSAKFF